VANGNILQDRKGNKIIFFMCENLRAQYLQVIRGPATVLFLCWIGLVASRLLSKPVGLSSG